VQGIVIGETELIKTLPGNISSLGLITAVRSVQGRPSAAAAAAAAAGALIAVDRSVEHADTPWCQVQFDNTSKGFYLLSDIEADILHAAPAPEPIPSPPSNTPAHYTIDELNRVVRCDVSSTKYVHPTDEVYVRELMDRPDVTLILHGAAAAALPPAERS
jgi:hypothetical protein